MMEVSNVEVKRLLRTLELKAFRCFVDALRAQGSLTLQKRNILESVATALKIGDERCRSEIRRAVNDSFLNRIAQCSNGYDTGDDWRLDSARRIAHMPMVVEPTVFTALADNVSSWVATQNEPLIQRDASVAEILESKKTQKDLNASRYHTTKLLSSVKPDLMTDLNAVSVELVKLKSESKPGACHWHQQQPPPVSKPEPMPVDYQESNTATDNIRLEISYDDFSQKKDAIAENGLPLIEISSESTIPKSIRPTKCRTKSSLKRSKTSNEPSLPNDSSRSASILTNTIQASPTDPSVLRKRNIDSSVETASAADKIDELEKKKMKKNNTLLKPSPTVDGIERSPVTVDLPGKKISVNAKTSKAQACIADLEHHDYSRTEPPLPSKSNSFTQLDSSLSVEKDYAPHTFNLIPASRRLKLVKKTDQPTSSIFAKENKNISTAVTHRGLKNSAVDAVKTDQSIKNGHIKNNVAKTLSSNHMVSAVEPNRAKSSAAGHEPRKVADEKAKEILPVLGETKKSLTLLGSIKVRNLNARTKVASEEQCLSNNDDDDVVVAANQQPLRQEAKATEGDANSVVSDTDSSSVADDDTEFSSTYDDSDSPSVIEYWENSGDDDDDQFIVDDDFVVNGGYVDVRKSKLGYENGITLDDDAGKRHNAALVGEQLAAASQFGEGIIEEIVEDEEYLSINDAENFNIGDGEAKKPNDGNVPATGFSIQKNSEKVLEPGIGEIVCIKKTNLKPASDVSSSKAAPNFVSSSSPSAYISSTSEIASTTSVVTSLTLASTTTTSASMPSNCITASSTSTSTSSTFNATSSTASVVSSIATSVQNSMMSQSNNVKNCGVSTASVSPRLIKLNAFNVDLSKLKVRTTAASETIVMPAKTKNAIIVTSKVTTVSSKDDKPSSSSSSPPSAIVSCKPPMTPKIKASQLISISNARIIGINGQSKASTTPASQPPRCSPTAAVKEFPKVTVYTSTKVPSGSGGAGGRLHVSPSAPRRIILSQALKTVSADMTAAAAATAAQKRLPVKSFTMTIPKKVCRLYDLIDLPETSSSNSTSSSVVGAKKTQIIKKASLVNVSSS